MKITSEPPRRITSVHFRQRARHYRLAAAMSDAPRDVETFLDLAMMFERLSEHFGATALALSMIDSGKRRVVHERSGDIRTA